MGFMRIWPRICLWLSKKLHRSVFGYEYINPLESFLGAMVGMVNLVILLEHSKEVGGLLEEMSKSLEFLLSPPK